MNCSFPNRNPSVVVYGLQIEIEMCVYPHVVMENYASQNATPEPINISLIHFSDISSSTTLDLQSENPVVFRQISDRDQGTCSRHVC